MDPLSTEKELQEYNSATPPGGGRKPSRWPWLLALAIVALGLYLVINFWGQDATQVAPNTQPGAKPEVPSAANDQGVAQDKAMQPPPPSKNGVVQVDPQGNAASQAQAEEQAKRKEPYGLDKSLDAVVRSDESIKVGDTVVAVGDLERKLVVGQRGEILEKPLGETKRVSAWGVHVVRSGENLWDIHYRLLGEYLKSRGVNLPTGADRPDPQGFSSGVGKILKFAEHMVGVYNVKTGKMSTDLNLLEAGHKVVVFNLSEIFMELAKIDPHDLSGVMYDGRVLLFPETKKKSEAKKAVKE
jgi:hypothetical protein